VSEDVARPLLRRYIDGVLHGYDLSAGQYRIAISSATAVYAALTKIVED
jgi:hypothetical protein